MAKGIPVVVVEAGGVPVVPVESGAPLATVAENGMGVPVRLVERNAPPLVIDGLAEEPEE